MPHLASIGAIGPVLLGLAVILVAAKLASEAATRLRQPAVVGEILAGVLLGNLAWAGLGEATFLESEVFDVLAEIGILLLLFEIGVEVTVPQMLRTGPTAVVVAAIGVAAPMALGTGVSMLFLPDAPIHAHLFAGAILCATSVGITARVLQELGRTRTAEARLILSAAVIDDVLGLILLATVSGLVLAADTGAPLGALQVSWIAGKAVLFLVASVLVGLWVAPRLFAVASRFRTHGLLLTCSLAFCFLYSFLCTLVGLAPIVGAFTAGLVLEDANLAGISAKERKSLAQQLEPLTSFLLPVFFVLIGMKVDVRNFADPGVLAFAGVLTIAAVVGKLACGLAAGGAADRLAVGLGMIPRGEVGFIFAGIGTTLYLHGRQIVPPTVFASAVLVVLLTTLAAPPLLAARFARLSRRRGDPPRRPGASGR